MHAGQIADQGTGSDGAGLTLRIERLGPLPLVNHFADRLGLETLLERHVPTHDQ